MKKTHIDQAMLRELAVRAEADPRSVRRALEGKVVRGMAGRRIERVLIEAGLKRPAKGGAK